MDGSTTNDILLHLQKHGSITGADAYWTYGCYRLPVVISRLRKNHVITTEMTHGKNKKGKMIQYGTYRYWGRKDDAKVNH